MRHQESGGRSSATPRHPPVRRLLAAGLLAVLAVVSVTAQTGVPGPDPDQPLGLGLAVVRVGDAPPPLGLYPPPDLDSVPEAGAPADSVTFVPRRGRAAVGTAPPWFLPEVLDIARGHIGLRVHTLAAEWVEVVTNRSDGRTAWLRRDRVEIVAWPDVLLQSLLTIDPEANPLRTRPTDEASILATTPAGVRLRPLAVRGDWVQVSTLGLADRIPPSGWVRWTDGARLLVGGIGEE